MKFQYPPIAEVVIGAQFDGVTFKNENIFDFYQKIKSSFPIIEERQVLPSIVEKMDGLSEHKVLQRVNTRKFFINTDTTKLIQLQPDKLLFNWKKATDEEEYPHFQNVLNEFIDIYIKLEDYFSLKNKVNQLEVTYVDHIFMDDFGKTDFNPNEILSIFSIDENKKVKSIEQNISFPVAELKGNLNLQVISATRNKDGRKILRLETTCRGAQNNHSIEKWYDIAHDELLRLFEHITTEKAKKVWGIKK